VSGLARGIDSAAHDGSLDSGTVAVIAGGLDVVYPPENEARQADIAERGLLVAEMPPGTEPRSRHFPYRNRIIAGLSAGTVVVEAAPRSGSLITARLAGEAGREVMAVPGSPLDPRAQGCNGLIRDGATLIQNAADVLETLGGIGGARRVAAPASSYEPPPVPTDASPDVRARVEALLGPSAVPVDELIRLSDADAGAVQLILLELDLAGRLERHAGGKVSTITYPSQDPIAKTLASFQVNISSNPPLADLLNQLPGAKVTVGYMSEKRSGVVTCVEKSATVIASFQASQASAARSPC